MAMPASRQDRCKSLSNAPAVYGFDSRIPLRRIGANAAVSIVRARNVVPIWFRLPRWVAGRETTTSARLNRPFLRLEVRAAFPTAHGRLAWIATRR